MSKLIGQLNAAARYYDSQSNRYENEYKRLQNKYDDKEAFDATQQAIADIGYFNNSEELLRDFGRVRQKLYATGNVKAVQLFEQMAPGVVNNRLNIVDITEKRKAEDAVLKSFRLLHDAPILVGDKAGKLGDLVDRTAPAAAQIKALEVGSKFIATEGNRFTHSGMKIYHNSYTKGADGRTVYGKTQQFVERNGRIYSDAGTPDDKSDDHEVGDEGQVADFRDYSSKIKEAQLQAQLKMARYGGGGETEYGLSQKDITFLTSQITANNIKIDKIRPQLGGLSDTEVKEARMNAFKKVGSPGAKNFLADEENQALVLQDDFNADEMELPSKDIQAIKGFIHHVNTITQNKKQAGTDLYRQIAKEFSEFGVSGNGTMDDAVWKNIQDSLTAKGKTADIKVNLKDPVIRTFFNEWWRLDRENTAMELMEDMQGHPYAQLGMKIGAEYLYSQAEEMWKKKTKTGAHNNKYFGRSDRIGTGDGFHYISRERKLNYFREALEALVDNSSRTEKKGESTNKKSIIGKGIFDSLELE